MRKGKMRTDEPPYGARARAKKIFEKKLDNFKNLCYNKYVRLRGKQTSPSCGYGGTQTRQAQNLLPFIRRAGSSPAIRTWQGRARERVAARLPKISKEANSKEIFDRRAATRRNRISLPPLFYLDV